MGAGCLNCLCLTFGFLSVFMILLHFNFDSLLKVAVRSQLVIDDGNDLYKQWVDVPIGLLGYKYRFFEIENPDEALRGEKIRVRERGPYCFKHRRYKRVTGWGPNKETVKYFEYKVNYFDPECSGSNSLDDTFTMVNPLFAALAQTIADMIEKELPLAPVTSPVAYALVNSLLDSHGMTLFMKKSVKDILYGFKVNLLETMETFTTPLKNLGISLDALPPSPPGNMFGLLYGKNDTPEGEFEMYTGLAGTADMIGGFLTYKGKNSLSFWKGEYCNRISGGDGSLFPSFVTTDKQMTAFAADLCRSLSFAYLGEGEHMGIRGYRFGLPKSAFASPESNPLNECFCIYAGKKKESRCSINGAYDLGGCQAGAPLIVTGPHFLNTEPDLAQSVDGLNPNLKEHDTFLILEPTTGAPIYGLKRLQFSLRVERIPFMRNMQGIRSGVIPFVWAEEGGGLTPALADQLKGMLLTPVSWIKVVIAVLAMITPILFGICMLFRLTRGPSKKVTPITSPLRTVKKVMTGSRANSRSRMTSAVSQRTNRTMFGNNNDFPPPPPPLSPMQQHAPMPFMRQYERPSAFALTAQEAGNMTPGGYSVTSQPIAILANNGILYGLPNGITSSRQLSALSRTSSRGSLAHATSQQDLSAAGNMVSTRGETGKKHRRRLGGLVEEANDADEIQSIGSSSVDSLDVPGTKARDSRALSLITGQAAEDQKDTGDRDVSQA